jgi:transcriptional regulator with XRE-family HTH domain
MEKRKETINDRVKIVRKYLKMSQEDFAKKIKLETSNAISMIERGKNTLTGQNIQLICTPGQLKFGVIVNEDWLRNGGDSPMFKAPAPANGRPKLFDETGDELPQDEEEKDQVLADMRGSCQTGLMGAKSISALGFALEELEKVLEKMGGRIELPLNTSVAFRNGICANISLVFDLEKLNGYIAQSLRQGEGSHQ